MCLRLRPLFLMIGLLLCIGVGIACATAQDTIQETVDKIDPRDKPEVESTTKVRPTLSSTPSPSVMSEKVESTTKVRPTLSSTPFKISPAQLEEPPSNDMSEEDWLDFMLTFLPVGPELMFIEPGSGFIDPNKMGCEAVDCPPAHEAFKLAVIGQYYSALQLFETAAGRNPTNAGLFYNLGVTNMLLGNHGAAIRGFGEARNLNEQIAGAAYALRAVNYAKMGETSYAMLDVQQATGYGVDQESLMALIDEILGQR